MSEKENPEFLPDQAWRNQDPAQSFFEPTYGGTLSFLRRPYSKDLSQSKLVITGFPFDGATTYRPGCRLGPNALRAASVQLAELPPFPEQAEPLKSLRAIDYGDCFLNPHDPASIVPAIDAHATKILAHDTTLLSLGGDHFITYPLLLAHQRKYPNIALLHFDAHLDTWDSLGQLDHGSMFKQAHEQKLFVAQNSVQVGIRTSNEKKYPLNVIDAPTVWQQSPEQTAQQIKDMVKDNPVYLSFDIDVFDPAFAPGTGTPVPGGLASWQVLAILRSLDTINIIGADLVEVSPAYDHSQITAFLGAQIAYEIIALINRHQTAKLTK